MLNLINNLDNPIFFITLMIWSLIWKGFALWYAAQFKQKTWFVILLILNTVGLLEIIYLLIIRKKIKKESLIQPFSANSKSGL